MWNPASMTVMPGAPGLTDSDAIEDFPPIGGRPGPCSVAFHGRHRGVVRACARPQAEGLVTGDTALS